MYRCRVSVVVEVLARERAVLTLRFVDDWDMRRDPLLIDQPIEVGGRTIGAVRREPFGPDAEASFGPFDHRLRGTDLGLPDGARSFDIHDNPKLYVDEIVVGVCEERCVAQRSSPLRGRIGW